MDAPAVERELEIDLSAEELWELISTAEGWRSWLVDETALEVREGAAGTVVDDGERRSVVIERIADGEVRFVWRAEDGDVSRVVIAIDDTQPRVRLRITEQWLAPVACAECPLRAEARWDLRTCLLCLGALAPCRA
jgi:uncharacterized protein YndB with AHSA1/START domain